MPEPTDTQQFLAGAHVDGAVFDLAPGYRALLLTADGLLPAASSELSERLLARAEASARAALAAQPAEEVPHVAAWRDAYRSFGAKPQRTRNSLEALMRRAADGLPRVNQLTDTYNAISVLHQIPLGGEDLTTYVGSPTLVRATGDESFDTSAGGADVTEHPDAGEVVWRDDVGVTCRRWNWRQGRRTQLRDDTSSALFILDALAPVTDDQLVAAADELADHLAQLGPDVRFTRRVLGAPRSDSAH